MPLALIEELIAEAGKAARRFGEAVAVLEAAVVGMPEWGRGGEIRAFVVPRGETRQGSDKLLAELNAHMARRLPAHAPSFGGPVLRDGGDGLRRDSEFAGKRGLPDREGDIYRGVGRILQEQREEIALLFMMVSAVVS